MRPRVAWITARLHYNPYCDLPPTVVHAISIDIEPIELGTDAAMPDYETTVNSPMYFDGLALPARPWDDLTGTYHFKDDQDGSFCVSSAHNPVVLHELTLRHRDGALYDADATATFHFEFEDSGYADETTRLIFPVTHRGFVFCVPQWSEPDEVTFPADWRIPSVSHDWSAATIREFAGRYCDLSQYAEITIEDQILTARPIATSPT